VDDDPQTLRYVRDALTRAGYAPTVTGDPEEVSRLMREVAPHLVLLDLVLPGSGGIELMERVREIADVPVIFLSAYGQDEVIARAFDEGAADYVVKPFSPTELAARIRAALRQRGAPELAEPSRPYVRGDLTIEYPQRRVTVAGRTVALTIIEYRMLVELSANAGRPLTHEHLLQRVWGPDKGQDSAPVRNIVRRLRRKLGDDADNPGYIFAEPSIGYRMERSEAQEPEEA
jgi:two-component system KDP operon response regulator KdpE